MTSCSHLKCNDAHRALVICDFLQLDDSVFPFCLLSMTRALFPSLWVSLCVILALWLLESRVKMKPTSDHNPLVSFLLPDQRGGQSGASGVFWSLGLTESSLQNKKSDFISLLPCSSQTWSRCIPQTAALCRVMTWWLQAAVSWIPNCSGGFDSTFITIWTARNKPHYF